MVILFLHLHDNRLKVCKNFNFDEGIKNDKSKKESSNKEFSLSAFLACLDGHTISEGNIIIMTTNHVDLLDPACIRPDRMDVHLELDYCTHYQLNKMVKIVINN